MGLWEGGGARQQGSDHLVHQVGRSSPETGAHIRARKLSEQGGGAGDEQCRGKLRAERPLVCLTPQKGIQACAGAKWSGTNFVDA
jgi:hypothetical protein